MKNFTSLLLLFFLANSWHLDAQEVISGDLIHDDSLRTYKLYVPADYTGDELWPLVMVLHGYTLNSDFMMALTGMNAVADTGHFLIVYPQGLLVNNPSAPPPFPPIGPGWNIGHFFTSGNDDVGFVSKMIDKIGLSHKVDPARVYACGLSNGGSMVYRLACELSDRIAAVVSVSEGMAEDVPCFPGRPVPLMEIHGTADSISPYDGIPGFLMSTPESIDFWVNNNQCDEVPTVTDFPDLDPTDGTTVSLKKYGNCDEGAEVWLMDVVDGGHVWPTSFIPPPPFIGATNNDVHGGSEIWNFFNGNKLVTTISKVQLNASLSLHPNPASGNLTLQLESKEPLHLVEIEIFDILGQKVKRLSRQSADNALQEEIHLEGLPEGIYTLRVGSEWKFIAKKFVKMN